MPDLARRIHHLKVTLAELDDEVTARVREAEGRLAKLDVRVPLALGPFSWARKGDRWALLDAHDKTTAAHDASRGKRLGFVRWLGDRSIDEVVAAQLEFQVEGRRSVLSLSRQNQEG